MGGAGDRQLCGRHETMEKLPPGTSWKSKADSRWQQHERVEAGRAESVQVVPWSWHYTLFLLIEKERGTGASSHPELVQKVQLWILVQEWSQTQR